MSSSDVYIVSAARTPIGKSHLMPCEMIKQINFHLFGTTFAGSFNGAISKIKASDLGSVVIKAVLKRANCSADDVNEVIMGQALTANQGQNPARQASLQAGLSVNVPAYGLNLLCGSGLKAVCLGYQSIKVGDSKVHVCGGQESMSQSPHVIHLRDGIKMGSGEIHDTMLKDGLTDAMNEIHMGVTAENLGKMYNISREQQDLYSVRSQNLAEQAQKNGWFDNEIVPVEVATRKGTTIFDKDEYIKHGSTIEQLAKLKPCFITDGSGTVTAGNSSGINDSAAAVLLMSGEEVQRRGLKPLAKIVAWSQTGCNPEVMGIGPVKAVNEVVSFYFSDLCDFFFKTNKKKTPFS